MNIDYPFSKSENDTCIAVWCIFFQFFMRVQFVYPSIYPYMHPLHIPLPPLLSSLPLLPISPPPLSHLLLKLSAAVLPKERRFCSVFCALLTFTPGWRSCLCAFLPLPTTRVNEFRLCFAFASLCPQQPK